MVTWIDRRRADATIAGTLYGLDKSFRPFTYFQLLLPIFAAAIVGGLGNPMGAIIGGLSSAFAEMGITYAWRRVARLSAAGGLGAAGLMQMLPVDYKFASPSASWSWC
jgi:branched-chain amino acid transport system permease protein